MEKVRKSSKDRVYFYVDVKEFSLTMRKLTSGFGEGRQDGDREEKVPGWDRSSLTLGP
jgi:hypothetical protein